MCFSGEVDLLAGVVIGGIGVDTLRHVRRPALLPLAVVPAVLAVHQLVESLVWWSLDGDLPAGVGHVATWIYLVIAFGVLPVLVPLAVVALEPVPRRRSLVLLVGVGAVVATALVGAVVRGPITATVRGHYVAYDVDLWQGGWLVVLYVLATCGSMLLSSVREVRLYGAVNLVVVALLAWVNQAALTSLWCAWAAVTSVLIAAHLRGGVIPAWRRGSPRGARRRSRSARRR